jgi:hypothetical protein
LAKERDVTPVADAERSSRHLVSVTGKSFPRWLFDDYASTTTDAGNILGAELAKTKVGE